MKKRITLIFSLVLSMLVWQSDLLAQTLTYTIGSTTYSNVSVSTLTGSTSSSAGSLANASEISLFGSWSATNILTLKKAIKSSWTSYNTTSNSILNKVDMSGITELTGDFAGEAYDAGGFSNLFRSCTGLTTVIMPTVAPSGATTFIYAFEGCFSLVTLDLSAFDNISNMNFTFLGCSNLKKITMPTSNGYGSSTSGVSFFSTFEGCSSLVTLDLSGFGYISSLHFTFATCRKLEEIHLGIDPSSVTGLYLLQGTFSGVSDTCLKYLPAGVNDIPQAWKDIYNDGGIAYGNFVFPLTVGNIAVPAIPVGETLPLTLPSITPAYAAVSEVVWQIASDASFENDVETITSSTPISEAQIGYYLRCGVMSPNGVTYFSNIDQISAKKVALKAYEGSTTKHYTFEELSAGSLANASEITLLGSWSADNILTLKKAIKSSWTTNNYSPNSTLMKVDMSGITELTGDFASESYDAGCFSYLFRTCQALTTVMMPTVAPSGVTAFNDVFAGCSSLSGTVDLSAFGYMSNMQYVFSDCSILEEVIMPTSNGYVSSTSGVSFYSAFQRCYSLTGTVDLSGFGYISNMASAFYECSKLEEVTMPTSNGYVGSTSGVSFYSAFEGCSSLAGTVDLSGFGYISSMSLAFYECSKLERVNMPTSNGYVSGTRGVEFNNAFYGCSSLTGTVDLSGFGNISVMYNVFANCGKLDEIYLGTDPNILTGPYLLVGTFSRVSDTCLKYLPAGVNDIPQAWKDEYNAGNAAYGNFVLPLTVGNIAVPAIPVGETLPLTLPSITPAYAAVNEVVWQIAPDASFENEVETITSSTPILEEQNGYYLRCGIMTPDGVAYFSNVEKITVKSVVNIVPATNGTLIVKAGENVIANGDLVDYGTELTITATADEYYKLSTLTVNGNSVDNNSTYTVTGVVTVEATFNLQQFAVNFSAASNGTLTVKAGEDVIANGDLVDYGTELTITATADENYKLSTLTVNGNSVENNSTYTVTGVVTVEATFNLQQFAVNFSAASNGTLTVKAGEDVIANGDLVDYGTELTITATADENYKLSALTVNGNSVENNSTYTVIGDVTVEASFNLQQFAVNFSAASNGTLTVKAGEDVIANGDLVDYGTELTITATADDTYKLSTLTVNGDDFTSGNVYTVTGDVTVEATFNLQQFAVNFSAASNGTLTVKAGEDVIANGDLVDYGTELTITATANDNYKLSALTVNGNSVENNSTYTVTGDVTVEATFGITTSVTTPVVDNFTVYTSSNMITVVVPQTAMGKNIAVFNMSGKIIYSGLVNNTEMNFKGALPHGVYSVRVGKTVKKTIVLQ